MNVDYTNLPDDSAITIASFADVTSKRAAILQYLWGTPTLPTASAVNVGSIPSAEVSRTIKNSLPNLASSSKLSSTVEGITTYAYLFRPTASNGKAMIVHHGHACAMDSPEALTSPDGTYGITQTVNELLFSGYTVALCWMPHASPPDCIGGAHNAMFDIVPATGHPMKFFMEPICRAMNYLVALTGPTLSEFHFCGLSGGGWSTALYAAIDPRLRTSVQVAGSMPLHLRPKSADAGDFEQVLPEFYAQWGYPDLYVLACCGDAQTDKRRQVQVLNRRDTCCFTGATGPWNNPNFESDVHAYEAQVQATLDAIGVPESFRLEIDDSSTQHQISRAAIIGDVLLEPNSGRRRVGACPGHAFVRGLGGNLWHWDGAAWEDTGVKVIGTPAAIADTEHAVDVFVNSPGDEPLHVFKDSVTGAWTAEHMGGTVIGDVAVASSAPGKWDMVAIGMGHNMWQWYRLADGTITYALVGASNQVLGPPTVASYAPNRLDVVARGLDRTLWHYSSPTARAPWTAHHVGTKTIQDWPSSAIRPGQAAMRAYFRGADNRFWEAYWNGSTWQYFDISSQTGSTSTVLSGSPSASSDPATGVVRIVCRTSNASVASFVLSAQGLWSFANDGGETYAAPTSTQGGEYVRGATGCVWQWVGGLWRELGALRIE